MDAELGRKVLDHVTAHREQFDMQHWVRKDPECGTAGCLGGWTMLLSGYEHDGHGGFFRPDGTYVGLHEEEATKLLHLTEEEWYGSEDDECTLFGVYPEADAIARFRALVEAAEARGAS